MPAPVALRIWRLAHVLLHVLAGALTVALAFHFLGRTRRQALRARWSRTLLGILGIELRAEGVPVASGCLLVANHISWIDIFVINALTPTAFVSKAEIRTWPLVGWLAARNDTVFLRRGSRGHARIVNAEIATLLGTASNVTVFPEGTTTEGDHVLHFHGALLQPAIAAGKPVQALALSYHDADGARSKAPAYAGDTSFGECMQAIVGQRRIVARLHATNPMRTDPNTTDRRALARQAHERIIALVEAACVQPTTCQASPSSSRTAVSLPPQTQPESSAISPASR